MSTVAGRESLLQDWVRSEVRPLGRQARQRAHEALGRKIDVLRNQAIAGLVHQLRGARPELPAERSGALVEALRDTSARLERASRDLLSLQDGRHAMVEAALAAATDALAADPDAAASEVLRSTLSRGAQGTAERVTRSLDTLSEDAETTLVDTCSETMERHSPERFPLRDEPFGPRFAHSEMTVFSMIAGLFRLAVVLSLSAAPAWAQERRVVVVGTIGAAGLGHADSEQGRAPIFGGGVGFHLTPRLVVEGDVHTARVSHVFGRDHHDFTETTFTGSLLFRSAPEGAVHFIAGGGAGLQRAHTDAVDPPFRIDQTETIRLLHGRVGAEWDISRRMVIRTEGVLWFGEGLDWVVGARAGLGYRF